MVTAKVIKDRLADRKCGMCKRNDGLHPLSCYEEWLDLSLKLYRSAINVATHDLRTIKNTMLINRHDIDETLNAIKELVNLQEHVTSED